MKFKMLAEDQEDWKLPIRPKNKSLNKRLLPILNLTIYVTGAVVPAIQSLARIFEGAGLAWVTSSDKKTHKAPLAGRLPIAPISNKSKKQKKFSPVGT